MISWGLDQWIQFHHDFVANRYKGAKDTFENIIEYGSCLDQWAVCEELERVKMLRRRSLNLLHKAEQLSANKNPLRAIRKWNKLREFSLAMKEISLALLELDEKAQRYFLEMVRRKW